jgi:hypothetical protein
MSYVICHTSYVICATSYMVVGLLLGRSASVCCLLSAVCCLIFLILCLIFPLLCSCFLRHLLESDYFYCGGTYSTVTHSMTYTVCIGMCMCRRQEYTASCRTGAYIAGDQCSVSYLPTDHGPSPFTPSNRTLSYTDQLRSCVQSVTTSGRVRPARSWM